MSKSRLIMVTDFPDGEGTVAAIEAEFRATGQVLLAVVIPIPVTLRMKYEMTMAPEILLSSNLLQNHHSDQHTINELMKIYNAGSVRYCVLKIPENFPFDAEMKLHDTMQESLPQLMREVEEDHESGRRLRRLKVYFVKEIRNENKLTMASILCVVVAVVLYWVFFKVYGGF